MENVVNQEEKTLEINCSGFCNKKFHKKCLILSDYDVELIRKNCGINCVRRVFEKI